MHRNDLQKLIAWSRCNPNWTMDCVVQQNLLHVLWANDQTQHKGAQITPSQRMNNTTSRRWGGHKTSLTPPSFASTAPQQNIETIHHHRPPQPAPPKLPCTNFTNTGSTYNPPYEYPFLLKKNKKRRYSHLVIHSIRLMSAQRRLNGLIHFILSTCLCCIPSSLNRCMARAWASMKPSYTIWHKHADLSSLVNVPLCSSVLDDKETQRYNLTSGLSLYVQMNPYICPLL